VKLTVKLSYRTVDELLAKYGAHFTANGLFVRSKEPRAAGTKVLLKVQLADGQQVLQATGVVTLARARGDRSGPAGMKVEFDQVDAPGRGVVQRAWQLGSARLAQASQPLVIRLDEAPPLEPAATVPEPVVQGLILPDDVGEAPSEEVFIPPEAQIDEEFDRLLATMPGPVREFEPSGPAPVDASDEGSGV
jgi:molecular chaperone DnaK